MKNTAPSLYIDLGTANTLIYQKNKGLLLREPSVIAFREAHNGSRAIAAGGSAKDMLGKSPGNVKVLRPLSEGVIAMQSAAKTMVQAYLDKSGAIKKWARPHMVISLPCRVTEYEAAAVENLGRDLGASRVTLIDEPVAAALGAGLPVLESSGSLIVDIGGGTTEIALISCGGIVHAQAVRVGGDKIDTAIIEHMATRHSFAIGVQTAEMLKFKIASALASDHLICEAGGLNTVSGLPERRKFNTAQIFPAVEGVVKQIVSAVKITLELSPPEIAADISDRGIVLAGGGALLRGLAERFQVELGVKTIVAKDPLGSVTRGGASAVENFKLLDAIARLK